MMIDDILLRALAAGIGVAVVAAPLGCFIVWRRMAYFGATLAHSALLGVALGLVLSFDLTLGVAVSSVAVTLIVVLFQLGILAHAGLAVGLVTLSFLPGDQGDPMAYLFGDVLAVTAVDIAWIYGGGALVLATLALIWRPLLALTIHEELARAEGVPALRVQIAFMLTLAVAVAIAMKIVGVLLIVSLLIIPAAAVRGLSRTPEQMAILAAIVGAVSVVGGLFAALQWDTPPGPSIVVAATLVFVAGLAVSAARQRTRA